MNTLNLHTHLLTEQHLDTKYSWDKSMQRCWRMNCNSLTSNWLSCVTLCFCLFVFVRWSEELVIMFSLTSPKTSTRQCFRFSPGQRGKVKIWEQNSESSLIQTARRRAQSLTNPKLWLSHNSLSVSIFVTLLNLKRDLSLTENTIRHSLRLGVKGQMMPPDSC